MLEEIAKKFKDKYEAVNGIVHLAPDENETIKIVASILEESPVELIAMSELPAEISDTIEAQCKANGVKVLRIYGSNIDLPKKIDKADVGISMAAFAVVETGTIVEFTTNDANRLVSSLPNIHIAIVRAENIVETLKDAADPIRDFYGKNQGDGVITFISGPSRTGDIEMRLTLGVHGPKVSHVIVEM